MKNKLFVLLLSVVVLALLLAGCGSGEVSEETAVPEPTTMAETAVPTEAPVVETPTEAPTAVPEPTEAPTETPTEEPMVAAPDHNLTDGCVDNYDPTIDYFPEKIEVTHTSGFTVEYGNNYKVVTVLSPYTGAEESAQYLLVQCGTPAPEGFDQATLIEVPVTRFVAMSTTYLPALDVLGRLDALVGVDSGLYVSNETVRTMIANGDVAEVGSGADVNVETAVALEPDLIMTYASGFADYDAHPKLQEAGLTVALNAEYLDPSPLGRAEWVDYIALFFNEEAASEAWFADIAADYEATKALAASAAERPTVFANTPFDGTWYMPGGQSFTAQLLADAGADYLWADDDSAPTLFLDFESVFERAVDADYWINIGFYGSLADLAAADERFQDFAAFQNGRVYNFDARVNENGGNDIYESGVIFPNIVLADLVKIFHPDLLPDHELYYYRQME